MNGTRQRPAILFLTHRLPYAPNRGDRIRAYHTLRALQQRADVHVVSLVHDDEEASHAAEVKEVATSVRMARVPRAVNHLRAVPALLTNTPLTHVLLRSGEMARHIEQVVAEVQLDLVYAFCTGIADHVLRPPLDGIPLILDMVDVDSGKWGSLAMERPWWHPMRFVYTREARVLARVEASASRHARATTVVNERERSLLTEIEPTASVSAIGVGVDHERLRPRGNPTAEPVVIFCGVMNYEPNEQGVLWFIQHVWPLVLAQRPDARFNVVGANPTPRLVAAGATAGVAVTGSVARVEPFLWEAAVSVAPLSIARGMQTKVIEAVAAGLPVVLTPAVAAGLPPEIMPACVQAMRPDEFASEVIRLLALAPGARRERAAAADLDALSWPRTLEPLLGIVGQVIEGR